MSDKKHETVRLFAFWRYDLYPYVLGSQITKINEDGDVWAPSFQAWFKPLRIVGESKGQKIGMELGQLREEYRKEGDALLETYLKRAVDLLPEVSRR